MASNLEFIEFVCSQIEGSGTVCYRKMFGDYIVYLNEKTCNTGMRQYRIRKET